LQCRAALSNVTVVWIRGGGEADSFATHSDVDQTVRLRHAWRITKQERVREAEDSGVCCNRDAQCRDNGKCNQRISPQLPCSIAEILSKIFEKWQASCLAMQLFDGVPAAQLQYRVASCRVGRHTTSNVFFCCKLEVNVELLF